jgi:diguanylate cyclase (GGDEF)-like protein/PAS domain S-box-containing protein
MGSLKGETALLRFDITDAAVDAGDGLMYSSSTATYPSHYSDSIEEQIFGHPWTISFFSMPEFDAATTGYRSFLVLLIGLLVDLLVVSLLVMFWLQQQKTHRLALHEHTEEHAIRLGALIEALPDAIFFKDGEGRWQVVNSTGLQLFGLSGEGWNGLTDLDLAKRYPEMAEAYQRCADDDGLAWEHGERFDTIEEIVDEQGVRIFEVIKVPLFKSDGSRQGLVVIGRDISERRQNEATERRLIDSLRHLNEIAALIHLPLNEQLRQALALGHHHLGLEFGIVSHVEGDVYTIVSQVSPPDTLQDNQTFALAETYCSITLSNNEVLAIHDMRGSSYRGHPCYQSFALETYIGAPIVVKDQVYGTVNFTSPESYQRKFDEGDREFVSLLARWMGSVIEVDLAAQQLATNELKLQAIIDNEPGCVKLLDQEGRLLQMNPAGLEMIDAESQDQVLGLKVSELVLPPYRKAFNDLTERVFAGESGTLEFEICSLKKEQRWLETHAVPLHTPEGKISALLAVTLDITTRKATEDEIHRLAFFDPLTNLANRRLLLDRLDHAQRSCVRRNARGALLIIDLDNFKAFNDGLGHGKGDQLLQDVAQRLLASVRTDDTVGRIGGDEFVVILENLDQDDATAELWAVAIAEKIRVAVEQPSVLDEQGHYPVTASIGLCLFCGDEDENGVLFNHADQALYRAKHAGRNSVQVFQSSGALIAPA